MRTVAIIWLVLAWTWPGMVAAAQDGAPPAPTDARARNTTNFAHDLIHIRWSAPRDSKEIAGFEVLRATDPSGKFEKIAELPPTAREYVDDKVSLDTPYSYRVVTIGASGTRSAPAALAEPVVARVGMITQFQRATKFLFNWEREWLALITVIVCVAVVTFITMARRGMQLKVRKIAGLEAVDEAVGRATEMGRSCLFIPGIQDMNDIQTIAGITVLSRVAKTAAEYGAKVEVPTSRSLVMTTARETVQAAFMAAGRPDAYNQDLIYYVTDEQFGYVAYLQGMMVRQKPAACFYMGSFFAESLILAETGNSIGAIQIAGTAQPAQLPFFVAACDYTLIGEEFFAASAYLSGEPDQLGSLKGQDVGKLIVGVLLIVGCILATFSELWPDNDLVRDAVQFIKETMLT